MNTKNKNGSMDSLKRKYDSLKGWVGKNPVEKLGTVICVSTNNDGEYDIQFKADGKSTFLQLYKKYKETGSSDEGTPVSKEDVEVAVDDYVKEVWDEIEDDIEGVFFPDGVPEDFEDPTD